VDLNKLLRTQWDRTGAIVFSVLGAIFLLIGWIGVSGSAFLAEQAPYIISGGVGGVFFLGIGATLWISADLRDEWRKLDRIEDALRDGTLRWTEEDDAVLGGAVLPPDYISQTQELSAVGGSRNGTSSRTARATKAPATKAPARKAPATTKTKARAAEGAGRDA
jgi:hypothetical protein